MRFCYKIILLTAILVGFLGAQQDFLPFRADYAAFQGNNGTAFVEVYLSFFQSELQYEPQDSIKISHFRHSVRVFDQDSLLKQIDRSYKNTMLINQKPMILNQFMDVFAMELQPGSYKLVATLSDDVSLKSGEFNIDMEIPDFYQGLTMSHIEMATKAEKSNQPSNFSYKNNITIYPNPSRVYGLLYPVLYYYFEAYNLAMNKNGQSNYTYHYYITDTEGNMVRDFPPKTRNRPNSTIAEANGTNIIALPSQIYVLNIDLIDNVARDTVSSKAKFAVQKLKKSTGPRPLAGQGEDPAVIYETYSKEQLIDEFSKSRYIASSEEKDIFEELDTDGMRRFLAEFWKKRDPNPGTPVNEYKVKYFENIQLAEEQYSTSFRPGWKTDRGRVILVYGKPDEIERNPSTIDSQPYEVWYYYSLDGGSEFIFGDLSGHGEYELLHSSYRNELQDPSWRERIGGSAYGPSLDGF